MTIQGVPGYELKRIVDGINRDYQTSIKLLDLVVWDTPIKNRRGDTIRTIPSAKFKLRVETSIDPFHRRTAGRNRRTNSVCWHGASLFLMRLYNANPDAHVKTSKRRYRDLCNYKETFFITGTGMDNGIAYDMLCDCSSTGESDPDFVRRVSDELFGGPGGGAA